MNRYQRMMARLDPPPGQAERLQAALLTKNQKQKALFPGLGRKLLLAAVLAAATLSAAVCAAGWLGLRDLELNEEVILPQHDGTTVTAEVPSGIIRLQGFSDTPEARAAAEWKAFLDSYDQDGAILVAIGNQPTGLEKDYLLYPVYTREMADRLEEISEKYGLKLHTSMLDDLYTDESLCDQVGGNFLGKNRAYSTYMYEDGTFKFDGEIDLEGYGPLDYQFVRCVRGSFTDILLNVVDTGDYREWGYTTSSGVPVTLALAPRKALIIADLPDSFVTVNILAGTETGDVFSRGAFAAEDLERFADSFDFSLLTPARPADPSLPRPTLNEVLGRPSAEDFLRQTGMEEAEAQEFFSAFAACLERDDLPAAAEMLHYPAVVTWRAPAAAGTPEIPVESPEDLPACYGDIFTPGLWEAIQVNRYTLERADLTIDGSLICAAGGRIRFGMTEDGPAVLEISGDDGCSFRPAEQ